MGRWRTVMRLGGALMIGWGVVAAFFVVCPTVFGEDEVTLRALTFNVLVDLERKKGVPAWEDRKALCVEVVRESRPDVIGFQETSPAQWEFFKEALPEYADVGAIKLSKKDLKFITKRFRVYAKLGVDTYTDAILMYRKERFEKLDEGHWWQSPTPKKLSTGFGNGFPRIAVWAKLRDKKSGRDIVVVDTHFDNTMPSQVHMAKLSHEKIQPFIDEGLPVIFLGDFNTSQGRGDYPLLTSGGWRDSYLASPKASATGQDDNVPTGLGHSRIDHIFYHGAGLSATEWRRLESPDPERLLSDHYPVFAVLSWSGR